MTPVTRSDSSGASFLLDLARDLRSQQGIQLVLCNPTDAVRACGFVFSYSGWRSVCIQLVGGAGEGCREQPSQHPWAVLSSRL